MKVLFVVSNANCRGGTEILAYNLLRKLNEVGIECWLLSGYRYEGKDSRVLSFTEEDFKKWERFSNNPFNKMLGSVLSDIFLRKLIVKIAHKYQIDWIVNHTYDFIGAIPIGGVFKTAQVFNWSIVGYEESLKALIGGKSFVSRMTSCFSLKIAKWRWRRGISCFTKLVVLTEAARTEIKIVSPSAKEEQIITIPNPLMYSKESAHVSTLTNKKIVFVGRFSHEKGVMRLLHIWERVSKQLQSHTLCLYGEGYAEKEMKAYVERNKLERVQFMGFCSNLEDIYAHTDLCCVTSDTEGFGMVLIEAMYYGVPCISFDCPVSPKEIISNAGFTIPCFDEEAYANKVIELLENRQLMRKLQIAALQRAKYFYIGTIVQKWTSMFKGVPNQCED